MSLIRTSRSQEYTWKRKSLEKQARHIQHANIPMLTRGLASTANAGRAVLWRKISRVLESGVERRCTKTRLPLHAAIGLSMSDMRSKGFLMSSLFFWRGIAEVDRAQVHRRL